MSKQQVGIYHLMSEDDYKTSEQTACNYRIVRVPAGDYPIMADVAKDGTVHGTVSIPLPGTIVQSYWQNRVFWAVSANVDTEVGLPYTYYLHFYDYELAKGIDTGTMQAELLPDYRIVEHYSVLPDYFEPQSRFVRFLDIIKAA